MTEPNIDQLKHLLIVECRHKTSIDHFALIWLHNSLWFRFKHGIFDGNDVGGGIMNLFIFTNDPSKAFLMSKVDLPQRL